LYEPNATRTRLNGAKTLDLRLDKVLKLTGLKRQSRGHQERLKRIKDGKDMAKTRFKGFSVKKPGFQGLNWKKPGAET
jgi:hypothetical protein